MQLTEKLNGVVKRTFSIKRALRFVWESTPGWTIASLLILILEGLLPVASLYMFKVMLDTVTAALQSPDPEAMFPRVVLAIAIAGGIALINNFVRTLGSVVIQVQERIIADHMYDVLHSKSLEVDLEFYENAKYYDQLHRAQGDATYRPMMIVNGLALILRGSISLIGVLGLLLTFHWSVAIVLLVAVLPSILVRLHFSKLVFQLQRQYTGEERRAWYYHTIMTSLEFAKEVRIFGLGEVFKKHFGELRYKLRQLRLGLDLRKASLEVASQVIATILVFGSYGVIAFRVVSGVASIGDMAMFYQAFHRGQGFLQDILGGLASLYESNLFLLNLYEFLDLKSRVTETPSPRPIPKPMQSGITFDQVSFSYPNSQREALHEINLEIRPGEVVALVGENGSGKTTLVKLLCRLYDPSLGAIRIDGKCIGDFRLADLRKEIGIIFQDYAHYNLSARENIWLGDVQQPKNNLAIEAAARQSDAHEMLLGLREGYETVLGKLFENGEELSIGQWQKIALARAFLRNSQVIVLDEPTSSMDAKAEFEVFKKFRELVKNRTAILISHRLSTVRMADRIFVMQDGRIVERGSHDELMIQNGLYAHLYQIQAQQYQMAGMTI
jgi:ATP-binding cassette subfamily B protein